MGCLLSGYTLFHLTSRQKRRVFFLRFGGNTKEEAEASLTRRACVCGRHYKGDTLAHTAGVTRCCDGAWCLQTNADRCAASFRNR